MATKEARGTKRTCQNDECETKFYDLNRDPIVCPECESVYELAVVPEEEEVVPVPVVAPAPAAKAPAADGEEVADEDDALVSLEDADAELGGDDDDDEDDDTFLATDDDDDSGVGDIIGGVEKEDEES
ncbi:MAG: TIGR02300 family protein [Hyphomicrobiaceae bacterium]